MLIILGFAGRFLNLLRSDSLRHGNIKAAVYDEIFTTSYFLTFAVQNACEEAVPWDMLCFLITKDIHLRGIAPVSTATNIYRPNAMVTCSSPFLLASLIIDPLHDG